MFRATSIFLLLQQCLWLLVIVPGHERGSITLPGYESCSSGVCESGTLKSCCQTSDANADASKRAKDPTGDRARHCAICHIALRMEVATPPDVAPKDFTPALPLPPELVAAFPFLPLLVPFDSTGPPGV